MFYICQHDTALALRMLMVMHDDEDDQAHLGSCCHCWSACTWRRPASRTIMICMHAYASIAWSSMLVLSAFA